MSIYAYVGLYDAFSRLAIAYLLSLSPMDDLVFYALFLRVMKQVGDYCFQGSANPLEFHDRRN